MPSDYTPETPEEPESNITGPNVPETPLRIPNAGLVNLSPIEDEDGEPEPVAAIPVVAPPAPIEPVYEESPAPDVAAKTERAPAQRPQSEKAPPKRPKSQPITKQRYTLVTVVSALRALSVTFGVSVIVATIFMWFTSPDFLSAGTQNSLAHVMATDAQVLAPPTAIPAPAWRKHVGIVAGHSGIATYGTTKGNVDTGAVCPDGFTEASVTMNVARQAVAQLQGRGFEADLLEEFDLRLQNYKADAFISLHADSCDTYDDGYNHSGFKDSYPIERFTARDKDLRFDQCIRENYGAATNLTFTPGGITDNMTKYHAFHTSQGHDGIAGTTPALILELGMLSYDRDLLQNHTDKSAQGVVNGILCFLAPTTLATIQAPTATQVPTTSKAAVSPTAQILLPTRKP